MLANNYYYVIIGGGLSGLQLALEINRDLFFKGKSIAIIDPYPKTTNDKTWCFWEKGKGKWEDIIFKKWKTGRFVSAHLDKNLHLEPYSYKMIRSLDFYRKALEELSANENFHFIRDDISQVDPLKMVAIGSRENYSATHFFDSRISKEAYNNSNFTKISQHFKGWTIRTKTPCFNTASFTMMDFSLKYKKSTSFFYLLPFSEKEALIEFTFFTPFLTEEKIYDHHLKKYIQEVLKIDDYEVIETEQGNIPMTDFPFHLQNPSPHITKIGTGGSWVKGSTGYSFKSTEKKVSLILQNIKEDKYPGKNLLNPRFRFYDSIFLDVLNRNNDMGERMFSNFYRKNDPQEIMKYLDEETTILEEIKIMSSLFHPEFIKSFFRKISL